MRAYALVLNPLTAFSHVTAASILNLSLPQEHQQARTLHVTTDINGRGGHREGLKWHHRRLDPSQVIPWSGTFVTSPLRTWRDLADMLTIDDLVIVADELLQRRLCAEEELQQTSGLRHARTLTKAAAHARLGSLSPRETRLRLNVIRRGLPEPSLNEDIIEDGIWIGCGDLVWRPWRVIADYDGLHHDDPQQRHQDAQTRDDYTAAGWRHVAVTKKMTDDNAVDRIERALREKEWRP
ncbi:MAG: hypothetical protein V9E82_08425 [Candidatus Nanopelagicales bacterium]